ncbi:regulation of nuclear pre-mRNA domain-containing protein 2a [Oncorhynchus mykiss]|uniref:Regulation of nuclear pre-mRNA domain-containing protein 2 n=1 Tax=Oncorhynchus mykiss TaxID=8022 RepID=A0A8K9V6Y6_ONCMY|nr:regulation of nuclear pre-mRNA domain-containing protein 2a [Oncorhynchus mykiss]
MCGLAVQGPKMAAGSGASSGQSRGLPVALESTLDRRFQGVSNTMESIQGLSNWCIENKKYHSLIVRYWIKWLRKSEASHRLNLFYLANDVIQNCKRRNAIVYRTAFADVLPEAFQLVNNVGDSKVMKSVDRILTIWEERSVYTEQLIAELRSSLVKEESPAAVETPKAPVNPKAALQSKIVAEFVPQAFIDHLSKYHSSVEEVSLKEKQLAAMRVDVCSTEALKRLKDKAGGKRHSKDFEDGSAKLKEFVAFLDRQIKGGPPLLDALGNADIFYEMQYKEVKIVANAYKTFANRVSHLKRKLDSLKATLPDLDESPIPSPSMDAPSPNGSESPFHGLADPDSDLDGLAMDDEADITLGEAPSPLSSPGGSPEQGFTVGESDNRDVEDMELSDEEAENVNIIVEERVESLIPAPVPIPVPVVTQPPLATEAKSVPQATPSPALVTHTTNISGSLANVDLGKISSILSSITSVMKKPGVSPGGSLVSPSPAKTIPPAPVAPQVASPLTSILSKVDMTPEELFGALSESQGQASGLKGLSTRLNSPAENLSSNSPSTGKLPPSASTPTAPSRGLPLTSSTLEPNPSAPAVGNTTAVPQAASLPQSTLPLAIGPHRGPVLGQEKEEKPSASSLESKIHSFLQGNPGFNAFNLGLASVAVQAGGSTLSPLAGTETQGGTPVRDEAGGGTPTLDEIMDTPGGAEPFLAKQGQVSGVPKPEDGSLSLSPTACHNQAWQDPNNTHGHLGLHPGAPNGQGYHQLPYEGKEEMHGIAPSLRVSGLAHYQPITTQVSAPTLGEGLLSNTPGGPPAGPNADVSEGGWYGNPYPEGQALHPSNHNMAASGAGDGKTPMSGLYAYQGEGQMQPYQTRDPHALPFQQGANPSSFLNSPLPPIPQLPPPPFPGIPAPLQDYQGPPASVMVPVEATSPNPEIEDDRAGVSTLGGPVIISDPYHPDDFRRHPDVLHRHADDPYHPDDFRRHPDDLHGHSNLLRQPDNLHHLDDFHRQPDDLRRHPHDLCHPDDRYYHPDDFHHLPVDDPHYPYRVRERLTPPLSPSEDPYYYNYPPRSPSPPYGHRHPLPPHMNLHHPDHMPLPQHPLHLARHPHLRGLPRGPPRPPLYSPMFRGKRPGPPFGGHPRGGGPGGPFFPPKRPHLPPRF